MESSIWSSIGCESGASSVFPVAHRRKESPEVAAAREVFEETGFKVEIADKDLVASYRQPWALHFDHLYDILVDDETAYHIASLEIKNGGWYEIPGDVEESELTVATRLALAVLRERGHLAP